MGGCSWMAANRSMYEWMAGGWIVIDEWMIVWRWMYINKWMVGYLDGYMDVGIDGWMNVWTE